jgi:hypothetical protein
MSNIRKSGLAYLRTLSDFNPSAAVAVSKFYKSEESWTREPAWWFDLPVKKIENDKEGVYYLVGREKKGGFVVLEVPITFLLKNINKFETRYSSRIRLHLTAEGKNRLVDKRGEGRVDFSRFERACRANNAN